MAGRKLEVEYRVWHGVGVTQQHTIGEVARAEGVPTSTLRYYERVGLLRPSGRSGGNYRLYDAAAVERLRFIRAAQAIGFTLDDTAALLEFRDGNAEPCQEVQRRLEARLAEMDQRLEDLHRVRQLVKASLQRCAESRDPEHCAVIEKLSTRARKHQT